MTADANRDDDSPPLSRADITKLRPAAEVLAPQVIAAFRRGRGPQKSPTKRQVTLRLDETLIAHFKAAGPGWQTRLNDALREAVARQG
jgi:uncharacterized protein (DUF4415 family)